jgi:DMSO reductase family type II enzyme chaperone
MPQHTNLDQIATTRMAVYQFALRSLDKPSPEQHAWMTDAGYRQTLAALCEQFGAELPRAAGLDDELADHAASYIAWFEVGMPTPRVVLQASHYNHREPAPRILHEHVLFYRMFDAKLRQDNLDQPDHLLNQLAFLVLLDELTFNAAQDSRAIGAARRDFLRRHVIALVAQAGEAAAKHDAPPVYRAVLAILAAALDQDLSLTEAMLESDPRTTQLSPSA